MTKPIPYHGLEVMLAEFESNQLEVVLVPSKRFVNEGGCIRVAQRKNANWYRQFCGLHASSRRRNHRLFDTKIKRRGTMKVLTTLIATGKSRSKYADELISIALNIENQNPF